MPQSELLIGWKAIAAYLKRSPRTVQRWARLKGLPVGPIPQSKTGHAYLAITTSMIDSWLLSQHRKWRKQMSER